MNIVLDPYILGLEDEYEIKANISIFQILIRLCDSGRISVCLYKEVVKEMEQREIKPFPIRTWHIRDEELRQAILHLNRAFTKAMMNSIKSFDIEECNGTQDFSIKSSNEEVTNQLVNDSDYYEMLTVILQPCYVKDLEISPIIVTGHVNKARKVGDTFTLVCKCAKLYELNCRFGTIEEFESDQDRAYFELEEMIKERVFEFVESPTIIRGSHHNKLQKNSRFTTYEGLSRTNKIVITLLRKFGLSRIVFGEFHEDTSQPKGTIISNDIERTNDADIVKGWLYAETGYINHVDLYFPKGVGTNLRAYLNDKFYVNDVSRLVDSLLL